MYGNDDRTQPEVVRGEHFITEPRRRRRENRRRDLERREKKSWKSKERREK